jgi:hypothetical protein
VDLVGIEPTTSSMPFPSTNCSAQTVSEGERYRRPVFMRGLTHVRGPSLIREQHRPEPRERGRDRRVMTQVTTQRGAREQPPHALRCPNRTPRHARAQHLCVRKKSREDFFRVQKFWGHAVLCMTAPCDGISPQLHDPAFPALRAAFRAPRFSRKKDVHTVGILAVVTR